MNSHKNKDLEQGRAACDPVLLAGFERGYDDLLGQGRIELAQMREDELGHDSFRAMLNRLTIYKDCYLLFLCDYNVLSRIIWRRGISGPKRPRKMFPFCSVVGWTFLIMLKSAASSPQKKRKLDLYSAITQVKEGTLVLR